MTDSREALMLAERKHELKADMIEERALLEFFVQNTEFALARSSFANVAHDNDKASLALRIEGVGVVAHLGEDELQRNARAIAVTAREFVGGEGQQMGVGNCRVA